MRLLRGCLRTYIEEASDEEYYWLYDYLTFPNKKSFFDADQDKAFYLLERNSESFPSGMLPLVLYDAPQEGIKIHVSDGRPRLPNFLKPDLSWLYDFQREAVDLALREEVGIIWIPTGGGKTECIVAVGMVVPDRVLIFVPDGTLLEQHAERWERRTKTKAGRVGDGIFDPDRVTVATFQTLFARLHDPEVQNLLRSARVVIYDECHQLPADTFTRVAFCTVNARIRLGFSATPLDRTDKRSIYTIAATGPVIYRVRNKTLVEKKRISAARVTMVPCTQVADERWYTPTPLVDQRALYKLSYTKFIVESERRNAAVLDVLRRADKPALVFVKLKEHGQILQDLCEAAHISSRFLHYQHRTNTRRAAIVRLERGDLDAVIATNIFKQGLDVPELAAVLRADAGQSVIETLQKGGRGSRVVREDGAIVKDSFQIWDIYDRGHPWFQKHARARMRAYAREEMQVHVEDDLFSRAADYQGGDE